MTRHLLCCCMTLALLAGALCLPALAQEASTSASQSDRILAEVETFQYLHSIRLTAEQATTLATAMKPLADMLARRQAAENAPEVITVLKEFRAAALAGKPITEQMWSRLSKAKIAAGGDTTTAGAETNEADPMVALAQRVAGDFAGKLTTAQLSVIMSSETFDWASDILDQAQEKVAASQDEWDAWVDSTLQEIVGTQEGLAPGVEDKLTTYFCKLRLLKPEDIMRQRSALLPELSGLMTPPLTEAARRQMAAERLAETLLNNDTLYACLLEYAKAKTATP